MSNIAIFDIDTLFDYLDERGKLFLDGAKKIKCNLGRIMKAARKNGNIIISTIYKHTKSDIKLRNVPPHCLVGSRGQRKIKETKQNDALIIPIRKKNNFQIRPDTKNIVIEKKTDDAFKNLNLNNILKSLVHRFQYNISYLIQFVSPLEYHRFFV